MNLLDGILELHKRHRWLAHVLFWSAVLVVGVGTANYHDGKTASFGFELLTNGLYEIPEILAAYAVAYWVLPGMFYRRKYIAAAVAFLLIGYLACVLGRIFLVKIDEPLAGVKPKASETYWAIFTDIPKLLFVYFFEIFSMVFMFLALKTIKDQLLIRNRTLTLEKEKAETELKLLKAQLNPHFLFNTLNNIYSLSYTSPAKTSESIARLAEILDHILYRTNQPFVSLSAEIALIRNYIELEKLRYDNRLTVNFTCAADREVVIAPLILLSLVENAFKHGASNDAGEPVIDIDLLVKERQFRFEISNTVAAEEKKSVSTERIGLSNLQRQLSHTYGTDHELKVRRDGNSFIVLLTIDLKHEPARYEKDKMFVGG
jgi:hypothetical protein